MTERIAIGPVVVWGASGHARTVADILRLTGHEIAGFLDSLAPRRRSESFAGATVLGGNEQLERLRRDGIGAMVIAVGSNRARVELAAQARSYGFHLVNAIHPASVVAADAVLGDGLVIAASAVVNPGARVDHLAIINTGAIVEHDCTVAEGAHVAPGAVLAGFVDVGRMAFIGAGATVKDHIAIGIGAVVGAGSVVIHDVRENDTVVGVPARPSENRARTN